MDLHPLLSGRDRSLHARGLRGLLRLAEPFYAGAVELRNLAFDRGLRRAVRLPRPTISVGNLTTGGTGKTPMVAELARRLMAMGRRPAVLMRGYMPKANGPARSAPGSAAGSDERELLQRELAQVFAVGGGASGGGPSGGGGGGGSPAVAVPVFCDARRSRAAQAVLAEHPQVDVFLLDDGFQHRQVARDLDLVLIDATCPFGYGHVLPRGLLREPRGRLARADAVIVTRADQVEPQALRALDAEIARLTGRPPLAHAAHAWHGFRLARAHAGGPRREEEAPPGALAGQAVMAVCAIGNPQPFLHALAGAGAQVRAQRIFRDHHRFTAADVRAVLAQACAAGAQALVMTEKDWVKWQQVAPPEPPEPSESPDPSESPEPREGATTGPAEAVRAGALPVYRPRLQIRLMNGAQALDDLLHQCFGKGSVMGDR